jgi:hypothetical protein
VSYWENIITTNPCDTEDDGSWAPRDELPEAVKQDEDLMRIRNVWGDKQLQLLAFALAPNTAHPTMDMVGWLGASQM